jgi:hypothetical protein
VTCVMWNLVSVHLETVLVSVQNRCTLGTKRITRSELLWTHPMVLLGDEAQLKAILVCLEIVLIFIQDRYTVCAERTIGSKIILDTPEGTPR